MKNARNHKFPESKLMPRTSDCKYKTKNLHALLKTIFYNIKCMYNPTLLVKQL